MMNPPIAGIELFGGANVIYYAIACFTAYYFSGHSGIYHAHIVKLSMVYRKKYKTFPCLIKLMLS